MRDGVDRLFPVHLRRERMHEPQASTRRRPQDPAPVDGVREIPTAEDLPEPTRSVPANERAECDGSATREQIADRFRGRNSDPRVSPIEAERPLTASGAR